ncbi:hypothetical protein K525DRAFT_273890 [Schizophyllum commune Loenen D]|nr:hypothetical protein K525DRAFT_273890 [Schizophyllum commune Loenen D]
MLPQSTLRRYTVNLDEESGTGAERATPTTTDTDPISADAPRATPTSADATDAPSTIDAAPTTNDTPPTSTSAHPSTLNLHTPAQISALALVPHNICADTLVAGSGE